MTHFLGNVLVEIRIGFLLDCPLVLSLLKHKSVGSFLNKKLRNSDRGSLLNNNIDSGGARGGREGAPAPPDST